MKEDTNTPSLRFKGFEGEWEEKKLGEILQTLPFKEFLKEPEVNGKFEVIQQGNDPILGFANGSPCNDYLDTVVFGDHTMSLYKPRKPFFVATDGVRILKGKTNINGDFLLSLLERFKPQSEGYKRYYGIVSDSECSITFDLNEQRQIGAILHNFGLLISLSYQKLDKIEAVKKAMLDKMFPQKGSKVPEIRFKGFTGDWKEVTLSKLVSQVTRNDPSSEAPIMMITANDGFIDQSERYNFNNAGESLKKYILLKKGELAYNHGASKLRPYGSCFALTNEDYARIPFVYHCFSTDTQNPEFLSFALNGQSVMSQLRKIISSGARMDGLLNISFDEYTSISIVIPTKEEQDQIVLYFSQLDRLLSLHRQKLEKLQSIKKALLGQMFPSTSRARESERSEKYTEPEQAAPATPYDTKASTN